MVLLKDYIFIMFVLFVFECDSKPSFSLSFPSIPNFKQSTTRKSSIELKMYSGKRIDRESVRMVYYNDQTVAVVELGPNKLLLNCELIEIFEPNQLFDVLGEFKSRARPVGISFSEMLTLMSQCKKLDERQFKKHRELTKNSTDGAAQGRKLNNPFTLLNGIIPGTKWCGTGDIAADYYDLGEDRMVDTCCRAHDLCPVKIRAYSKKYNLTNNSLYTKSHCTCDDDLFNCLKSAMSSKSAQIMGNIYFNLVQVPCLEDTKDGKKFRTPRNSFK